MISDRIRIWNWNRNRDFDVMNAIVNQAIVDWVAGVPMKSAPTNGFRTMTRSISTEINKGACYHANYRKRVFQTVLLPILSQ